MDLDGTLIASDLSWESVLLLVRTRPADLLRLPAWLLRGRAYFKRQVAQRIELEPETLPYRVEVLDYLRDQQSRGRRLVLTAASDERLANAVAHHLGFFELVIASDGRSNLKGASKLRAIVERLGPDGYDYMGNSSADLPVWEGAAGALLVHPDRLLLKRASGDRDPLMVLERPGGSFRDLLRALRPHQWAKNVLLAVPLVLAHQVGDVQKWETVLRSFVAFSAAASAAYVLNDLLDLPADRKHPSKRKRPFAAGRVSLSVGAGVGVLLLGAAAALCLTLPAAFAGLLALYLCLTTAYSVVLKQKLMVDVLCLAGLYTLRLVAGAAAVSVVISPWTAAFSMFLFLSLAFAKRYTELSKARELRDGKLSGRGYRRVDLELIRTVGPTSGYLAVMVMCLYINSNDVTLLYKHPQMLWGLCPVLLYWITRVWFLAQRGELHDDPVLFALRDRNSYAAGLLVVSLMAAASL